MGGWQEAPVGMVCTLYSSRIYNVDKDVQKELTYPLEPCPGTVAC